MQTQENSGVPPPQVPALVKSINDAKPLVHKVMSNWQVCGFSLGIATSLVLDADDWRDFDTDVLLDYIDEILHSDEENWDDDRDTMSDEIIESPQGPAIRQTAAELMVAVSGDLEENQGQPSARLIPPKKNKEAVREFAQGLVRGLVFGVEDESELESGPWGEAFSLLFILSEQDHEPDFGSTQDIGVARNAVVDAIPGLIAEIWEKVRET